MTIGTEVTVGAFLINEAGVGSRMQHSRDDNGIDDGSGEKSPRPPPSREKLSRSPPSLNDATDDASLWPSDEGAHTYPAHAGEGQMIRDSHRALPPTLPGGLTAHLERLRAAVGVPQDLQALHELANALVSAWMRVNWRAPLHRELRAEYGSVCCAIVKLAPEDFAAQAGLARHLVNERQFREALVPASAAVALQPKDPAMWFLHADALAGAGRIEEAISKLRHAARLSESQNIPEAAIGCYQRILELAPEDAIAKNAIDRLRECSD